MVADTGIFTQKSEINVLQLSGEFIACIAAILFFTSLSISCRILAIHAITAFLVELTGFILRKHGYTDNQWLFNIFLLFDCGLQLLAAYYFRVKIPYLFFITGFLVFVAVWLYEVINTGVMIFTVKAYIVDSILLMGTYLVVLYYSTINYRGSLTRSPSLWICLSIILYYGCNIPFFSVLNYLVDNKAKDVIKFLFVVLQVLINVRYLFIAIGFYLYFYSRKAVKPGYDVVK